MMQRYLGYIENLEAQLAEANDKARLQRALDRIEATGYEWMLKCYTAESYVLWWKRDFADVGEALKGAPMGYDIAELAEIAAERCESQKEAAHE